MNMNKTNVDVNGSLSVYNVYFHFFCLIIILFGRTQ